MWFADLRRGLVLDQDHDVVDQLSQIGRDQVQRVRDGFLELLQGHVDHVLVTISSPSAGLVGPAASPRPAAAAAPARSQARWVAGRRESNRSTDSTIAGS